MEVKEERHKPFSEKSAPINHSCTMEDPTEEINWGDVNVVAALEADG
jgi:hypothetical protein